MFTLRRATSFALMFALVMIVAAGCGSDDSSGTSSKGASGKRAASGGSNGCKAGPGKIDGLNVMQHCGDAKASVTVNGTKTDIEGGKCVSSNIIWSLNAGASIVDPQATEKQRDTIKYFGVTGGDMAAAGRGETGSGSFDVSKMDKASFTISFATGDFSDSLTGADITLKLDPDGTSGSFSGTTIFKKVKAKGTFSCG